jgi:hypothetical protein
VKPSPPRSRISASTPAKLVGAAGTTGTLMGCARHLISSNELTGPA